MIIFHQDIPLRWHCSGGLLAARSWLRHLFSAFCTLVAVFLAWRWLRAIYCPGPALLLALALALNWTWGRVGASIQSEPLFVLCELLTVLIAVEATHRDDVRLGMILGSALATTMLVRHVGAALSVAILFELGLSRRWRVLITAMVATALLIIPWLGWLAMVHRHSQLVLFTADGLAARIMRQAVFYLQRIPDQITGPFVEVGAASTRQLTTIISANLWAALVSGIVIFGWVRTVQYGRRRLAGTISFTTIALLLVWPFTEAGRFLIPLVPFMLVGMTEGLAGVLEYMSFQRPREWATAIVLALSIPYPIYSVITDRAGAQRGLHADFDAACQWIAHQSPRSGPILTRHAGEAFRQTGHPAIEPSSTDPDVIGKLINDMGVDYLLIDENRYMNATTSPLEAYVERYPDKVVLIWTASHGNAVVQVFEVRRAN